ncbi:hypothetical protein VTK26DRAFT_3101 [Humicola hyalothermophila]
MPREGWKDQPVKLPPLKSNQKSLRATSIVSPQPVRHRRGRSTTQTGPGQTERKEPFFLPLPNSVPSRRASPAHHQPSSEIDTSIPPFRQSCHPSQSAVYSTITRSSVQLAETSATPRAGRGATPWHPLFPLLLSYYVEVSAN